METEVHAPMPKARDRNVRKAFHQQHLHARAYANRTELLRHYETREPAQAIVPEEGEHLLQYRQTHFREELALVNRAKQFHLDLEFGDYCLDYALNGSQLALASSLGHVALLSWKNRRLLAEFHVKERVRAVKFVSNGLLAVAQASVAHIYDGNGLEVHRLDSLPEPMGLEYLPYHYLLATVSAFGKLSYLDVSTGKLVAEIKTQQREAAMRQDPSTAVLAVAGNKGTVGFFSPAVGKPLLKLLAHNARVIDLAFTLDGRHLVTAGEDRQFKVFDVRNTCRELFAYYTEKQSRSIDISQTGVLAVSCRNMVVFWKDFQTEKQKRPYLRHDLTDNAATINHLRFAPYEDFLGVTSTQRFDSIIVPGSGFAHFDTFEQNVTNARSQNRQSEVRKLLEKLPFETITLDPQTVGQADPASKEVLATERKAEKEEQLAREAKQKKANSKKNTKLNRNVAKAQLLREQIRQGNVDRKMLNKLHREKITTDLNQLNSLSSDIDLLVRNRLQKTEEHPGEEEKF